MELCKLTSTYFRGMQLVLVKRDGGGTVTLPRETRFIFVHAQPLMCVELQACLPSTPNKVGGGMVESICNNTHNGLHFYATSDC